jgi:hypothetical protein
MPDQPTSTDATQPEWERHGFASKAEMDLEVYKITSQQSKERYKRRQALYDAGYLTAEQFYNNR